MSVGKQNVLVAFSGGRTSAFKSWWLKENMSHVYNLHFVYANTGLEHEKTLEFVNKCDKHFNLNLTWVEAVINKEHGVGTDYKVVDYNSACRDNRLFDKMAEVYGIPNQTYIHCTRELKQQPIRKFGNDYFGVKNFTTSLGIRNDEYKRVRMDQSVIYPLANIIKVTKQDIINWWANMPFDLEIDEHYGNCVGCYKKSDKKLKMIADENPHYFDPFIELENKFSNKVTSKEIEKGIYKRIMYRGYRTAYEVKNNLRLPDNLKEIDECSEECGSVLLDYESIRVEETNLFNFMEV